jgi:2-methylcitrate dehydratase PrpD
MKRPPHVSPLTHALSTYMAGALARPLPPEVAERAKHSLIDTFAAVISGLRLLPGKKAISYVRTLRGPREAGVFGTNLVTSTLYAALANGMCAHADECDDTHPPSVAHPGCGTVPAAMAVGERKGVSGEALLRAMVLGYDVCARTVMAIKPRGGKAPTHDFARAGHDFGAHGQLFGAGAAAAALLGLDARQMRFVLSYCASQAAGLFTNIRDSEHVEKSYAASGMHAHNGVVAAQMVAHGLSGVEDVFAGDPSYISIFSSHPDPEALVRGLGRTYEIMNGAIKRWTVGGPAQGPLHVLQEMIRAHGLRATDVQRVVATIPDKELFFVNNRDMPDISLQYLLAVMLIDGTLTFEAAHDYERMHDPRVRSLARRVEAVGDPALTDPLRRWRCVMELTLKDGRKLTHQTMAAKGTADNPMTRAELEEKALALMVPTLGKARTRALIDALWRVESVANVRTLRKLYTRG